MSGQPEILVIGASFTDLCFYTGNFPKPGETVTGTFKTGFGGKGSNQSLCMAKLHPGLVHFISSVGNDIFGNALRDHYKKEGISHFFVESQKPTGCAGIYINGEGQNEIIIAHGAMEDLKLSAIKDSIDKVLPNIKYMICQCEMAYKDIYEIVKYIKEKKSSISVVLNPAPFQDNYDYKEMFKYVDLMIPNEIENDYIVKKYGKLPEHIKQITTLGSEGCKLPDGKVVPATQVKAVDTTGAGDCWIGAFFARLSEVNDFEKAAAFANKAAGISVTRLGTAASCPERKEMSE